MNWQQRDGCNRLHEVWILLNDKNDLLARIEGFGMGAYYPWVMDDLETGILRRIGPISEPLADVKARCERILSGEEKLRSHDTAGTDRSRAYRGEPG